jgi:N-acetylneuraminic acid mutarotase
MKKLIQISGFLGLFLLTFQACEKWNLAEEDFIAVTLNDVNILSLISVELTAEIKDLKIGQVSNHGFLWTTKEEKPTFYDNEGIYSLGIKDKEDPTNFSANIENLDPNTQYTFVAFAILGDAFIYSEPMNWKSGQGMVFTDSLSYKGGRSLAINGSIRGTEAGIVGNNHGFCWSAQNKMPTLNDKNIDLGNFRSNLPFSIEINDLKNKEILYIRAYAIFRHPTTFALDTVYGEVKTFQGELFNIWEQKANLGGEKRKGAVVFSINGKAYIGTGSNFYENLNDFWEYDPKEDSWTQKADFGGEKRRGAVGFSINNKGYIGTGTTGYDNTEIFNDFWEYNPKEDSWTQKADFGGEKRWGAVGFSINDKGYIGTGTTDYDNTEIFNDFWEYNPKEDSWTQKKDLGETGRSDAIGFSINDKGYIGTGTKNYRNYEVLNDFWEYNPKEDSWTQKKDFEGEPNYGAVGFSIHDKGYIGLGYNSKNSIGFWEYNPQEDNWTQKADFQEARRYEAIAFSINNKGYIGTGEEYNATPIVPVVYLPSADLWEYTPQ